MLFARHRAGDLPTSQLLGTPEASLGVGRFWKPRGAAGQWLRPWATQPGTGVSLQGFCGARLFSALSPH